MPLEYETEFLHMPSHELHLIDVSLTHPSYVNVLPEGLATDASDIVILGR